MAVTWIGEHVGFQPGPVNVGAVRLHNDTVLLVDSGLDPDRGRKVLRDLEAEGLGARALLLTHSHADHMGGAAFLRRRGPLLTAAAPLEAALVRYPALEPFYLFGGAAPPHTLTGKFLQAEPCEVDLEPGPGPWEVPRLLDPPGRPGRPALAALPDTAGDPSPLGGLSLEIVELHGHSPGQIGLVVATRNEDSAGGGPAGGDEGPAHGGPVVFCGDAVFPLSVWDKHGFVYFADVVRSLASIERLRSLKPRALVAGHGAAFGDEVGHLLDANVRGLEALSAEVETVLHSVTGGSSTEDVLAAVAERREVSLESPPEYYLAHATVQAHLARLESAGRVTMEVGQGRLLWLRDES